ICSQRYTRRALRGGLSEPIDHFVMAITAPRRVRGYLTHVDRWVSHVRRSSDHLSPTHAGLPFCARSKPRSGTRWSFGCARRVVHQFEFLAAAVAAAAVA